MLIYNYCMNWLLIASDEEKSAQVCESLNKLFPEAVVYQSGVEKKEVRALYEILSEITGLILISDKISSGCELIVGYLCGNKVPVLTNAAIDSEVLDCFETLNCVSDVDAILAYLKKNKKKISREVQKREALNYLFEKGIPYTPDHFSKYIEKGNLDICECYLAAGMDVNSRDKDGTPMLNIAVRNDNTKLVEWLLKNGAELNPVSEDRGYTPLMDAVWRKNTEITKLLIDKGADVNIINKEGQTMIILSVGADNVEISRMLCEAGADVDIQDQMGMSAYGYASLFKKQALLEVLEKYHKEG